MDLTLTNVLTLAATTGIFTTLLNQGLVWVRERQTIRRRKKSEATYLAIRLAVILEEFVVRCRNRAWHDEADLSEGRVQLDYNLPTLASYPQDSSDWKSFHDNDPKLAGQILSFPNEITSVELLCEFQGLREGNQVASMDETIVAGGKAWRLAKALRKRYDLGAIVIDNVDFLEHGYQKILQRDRDFVESAKRETVSASINQAT